MTTTVYCTNDAYQMVHPLAIRIYDDRPRYFQGGLHHTAEAIRKQGRFGDDVLLHVTPDEFNQLKSHWGEPTVNPKTGLPEYGFLSKIGHALKSVGNTVGGVAKKVITNPIVGKLAPIAANFFLPGVGGLIASAALGAVRGKLTGGNPLTGALSGALAGGVGKLIPGLGGVGGKLASNIVQGDQAGGQGGFLQKIMGGVSNSQAGGGDQGGGILDKIKGFFTNTDDQGNQSPAWGKIAGTGLGALALLKGISGNQKSPTPPPLPASMTAGLPQMVANRPMNNLGGRGLLHYGESPEGEFNFFQPTTYTPKAGGGSVEGPGSGRDDKIDALLSDGEYVVDAESVAMLGDGSLNEGAKRLDTMRENLRKHKGQALAKGKFSPDAKAPEQYMGQKKFQDGGNVQLGVTQTPPVNSNLPSPLPNPQGEYADDEVNIQPMQPKSILDQARAMASLQELMKKVGGNMTESERRMLNKQAKGGYVNSLEFWNKEGARIGKQLKSGNFDGPAEEASLRRNKSIISTKVAGLRNPPSPKYSKGGDVKLRGILGGRPPPTLEERAANLDAIQRIIDAYRKAQGISDETKKQLGITEGVDPYNNQPKPPLKLVEARGGLIAAQRRVAKIKGNVAKLKKAKGGPVEALTSFADQLEDALKAGNTERISALNKELDNFIPSIPSHYEKGGVVSPEQVASILEKSRIPPAAHNPDALRSVADELRRLNPNSSVLKQYDAEVARAAARRQAAAAPAPTAPIMAPPVAVGGQ